MKFLYQFGLSIGLALASILLVCGALFTASAEGISQQTPTPEPTQTVAVVGPGIDTPTPRPTDTLPPPISCLPPKDWVPYTINDGDTIDSIAQAVHISTQDLSNANCLLSTSLQAGTILYIPPLPTATFTKIPPTSAPASNPPDPTDTPVKATPRVCSNPPSGWVRYVIKQHDTLYEISAGYGINMAQLQIANCISNPDDIKYGMTIYVPNTFPTATHIPAPTNTNRPAAKTSTPVPTNTYTNTAVPSNTPTPLPTFTKQPTNTPLPTNTPTFTALPTSLPTDTPADTITP